MTDSPCAGVTCYKGGHCVLDATSSTGYICDCPTAISGPHCEGKLPHVVLVSCRHVAMGNSSIFTIYLSKHNNTRFDTLLYSIGALHGNVPNLPVTMSRVTSFILWAHPGNCVNQMHLKSWESIWEK